jgi:hypothetical protein
MIGPRREPSDDRAAPSRSPRLNLDPQPYQVVRGFSWFGLVVATAVFLFFANSGARVSAYLASEYPEFEYLWIIALGGLLMVTAWGWVVSAKIRDVTLAGSLAVGVALFAFTHFLFAVQPYDRDRTLVQFMESFRLHLATHLRIVLPPIWEREAFTKTWPETVRRATEEQLRRDIQTGRFTNFIVEVRDLANRLRGVPGRVPAWVPPGKVVMPPASMSPEFQARLRHAVENLSLMEYLDWKARLGVPVRFPRARKPITLPIWGAWLYWFTEALALAVAAGIAGVYRARQPFCQECGRWKENKVLGKVRLLPHQAIEIFSTGDLARLADDDLIGPDGETRLSLAVCPHCRGDATIDLRVEEEKSVGNNQKIYRLLTYQTYPGEALAIFETLFRPAAIAADHRV